MADEPSSPQLIPECISKPVKSLLTPPAKEIGMTFADLIYLATGRLHFKVAKQQAQYDHDLQELKDGLDKKISNKPEEALCDPKLQVAGPAIEAAKYCLQEPQIREMFQNLIANAADSRYQQEVHPAFPAMITQMSPLDAENLALFQQSEQYPIAEYRYICYNHSYKVMLTNCFFSNPHMQEFDDILLQSASLSSLDRQGLVTISYNTHLTDADSYTSFENNEIIRVMKTAVSASPEDGFHSPRDDSLIIDATFERGRVSLTPLGKSFLKVCFST